MRFRKPKVEELHLGITPLIDVVFLLLIFFMLTSHFHVASGLPIQLPKVTKRASDGGSDKITLIIDKEDRLYVMGEKVDIKDLASKLKALTDKEGLSRLVLEADGEVKHKTVVTVMDIAKQSGVTSIIIAARWETEKEKPGEL
ncbi:MAG: biopolymer transporter ExbD [Desulfatiglans sp.]|jgi:biopolymer transport protein ExbD|nr:biopolymer transporter ExbD [Thermodesulfobacteriota bacterium]MEE4354584.1 biopolymer transporter ExbD [Desulfatiglans sp.]